MSVNVGSATGYLDLDISGFLAGLQTAQSEANKQTKNIVTTIGNNISGIGDKLSSVGSTLTKTVTVPLAGIGVAGLKVATDFEKGMSEVKAISGTTGEGFDALRDKAIELGADTAFSAGEVASAMTEMAKAGWGSQQIIDGMGGVLAAAAASGEGLASVSTIVADAITGFGMVASDSTKVADLLTQAANSGTIGIADLGESFKYIAPVAGSMGLSIEDVTTALSAMSMAGIKSSQAGTALRTLLTNMVKPTEAMATVMNELGISATNSDGSMKSLDEIVTNLRDSFSNLTEAEKAQYAATLAGKEGMSGLLSLLNLTEEEYNAIAESMDNAGGVAEETAAIMQDNLQSKTEQLLGSLESLAIKLADFVIPHLRQFVEWLTALVDKFTNLDPETQKTILKFAAMAAVAGPVLVIFGKLVSSIGSVVTTFGKIPGVIKTVSGGFTTLITGAKNIGEGFKLAKAGFTALGAQASPLGAALAGITVPMVAIVAAVTAVIAAFVSLWKNNEEFRNNMIAIWNEIKDTLTAAMARVKIIFDQLQPVFDAFKSSIPALKVAWEGFCNILAPLFEGAFQLVSDTLYAVLDIIFQAIQAIINVFKGDFSSALENVGQIFADVWYFIVDVLENVGDTLIGILEVVCGWFGTTWGDAWDSIKNFFTETWNSIVSFFTEVATSIKTSVSDFVSAIVDFFAELPKKIKEFVSDAYKSVTKWAKNMIDEAKEMGKKFLNAVVDFFTDLPYKVGYFIGNTLTKVVLWADDMVKKAKETGKNFLDSVVEFFTELPGNVLNFVTTTLDNVKTWATDMADAAKTMGTNFINRVVEYYTQLPGKVLNFLTATLNNVKTWASNMATQAKTAASNFINNVVENAKALPDKVKGFLDETIARLKTWVTNMGTKGKEAIQTLTSNITSAAKSIPSQMASIGSDIVNGVWRGISNAASWFRSQVTSFFSGMVDGVKSALGIRSPSRVFANEIGKWLPPGVVKGFESALPASMKQIQNDLNDEISDIKADDISVGVENTPESFANRLKDMYTDLVVWFESIEVRIEKSVMNMMDSLEMLIREGQVVASSDGVLGYVGYNGFTSQSKSSNVNRSANTNEDVSGGGDTFIFYSPTAIDEVEAAHQMKKAKRELAEGF